MATPPTASFDPDAPPPELIIKPSSDPDADDLSRLTDHELIESIRSMNKTLETALMKKLPNGGTELRAAIKRSEEELSRRKVKGHQEKKITPLKPNEGYSKSHLSPVKNESWKRQKKFKTQSTKYVAELLQLDHILAACPKLY